MKPYSGSIGRRHQEDNKPTLLNPFLEDSFRIIRSDSYERLKENSRVLQHVSVSYPFSVGTRKQHSRNVRHISSRIAEALGLNKELCISTAEAHDLGHPVYCHIGETALSELSGKPLKHSIYGAVVAQHIANKGKGLNLTYETLEGITLHSNGFENLKPEHPLEYFVVAAADTIDWVTADLDEVVISKYLNTLPDWVHQLGSTEIERKQKVMFELITNAQGSGAIKFVDGGDTSLFLKAKEFLVQEVYGKLDYSEHRDVVFRIHDFFKENIPDVDPVILTSLVTDIEANMFARAEQDIRQDKMEMIKTFRVYSLIPYLQGKEIDYTDPDLGWGEELIETE